MVDGPRWEQWDAPVPQGASAVPSPEREDPTPHVGVRAMLDPILSRYPLAIIVTILLGMHLYSAFAGSHPLHRDHAPVNAVGWLLVGTVVAVMCAVIMVRRWGWGDAIGWLLAGSVVWAITAVAVVNPVLARNGAWGASVLAWFGVVIVSFLWLRERSYGLERAAQSSMWLAIYGIVGLFAVGAFILAGPGTIVGQIVALVPWVVSGGAIGWEYVVALGVKTVVAPPAATLAVFLWWSKGSVL